MGFIYNGVCSSLVALFSWQQVTNLAAVMAHCVISLSRYVIYLNWCCCLILCGSVKSEGNMCL